MERFVALYRGINVGGRNRVNMDALRALHESLGHRDVSTYIQSGNVLFSSTGAPEAIAHSCAVRFAKEFDFAAKVLVVNAARWGTLVQANPFARHCAKNPKTVHVGICDGDPSASGLKMLLAKTGGTESFTTKSGAIYLHAPDGFGTSKFAAGMEKAAGVPVTVRNWSTMEAIARMLDVPGPAPKPRSRRRASA